jgi:hypothetical protein
MNINRYVALINHCKECVTECTDCAVRKELNQHEAEYDDRSRCKKSTEYDEDGYSGRKSRKGNRRSNKENY